MIAMQPNYKRLIFYWLTSFASATAVYYLLWLIMPHHYVFGAPNRMFLYHVDHPIQYISIPCFFYGFFANLFAAKFSKAKIIKRILLTLAIVVLTVLISSPFGGMLWHLHDMLAGYFPSGWPLKMITYGTSWGIGVGWLIIGISIPYNIIGTILCYFITKKGIEIFKTN